MIFPPGFAERNNIELKRPTGYEDKFSWYEYLKETRSQAAAVSLFCRREDVKHGFKVKTVLKLRKGIWKENKILEPLPQQCYIKDFCSFKVGMKVEATDLMDPRLVCVSFISRVVGRLLKVTLTAKYL